MASIEDEFSCIKTVNHVFEIALPPRYIGDEERAIIKVFNSWKYKHNTELKGVLLYYDDLKFIGDLGRIIEDQPFIFWKVSGKFQVFYTSVGDIIKGKINRFGRGFFGCIIADCINATIHQPKNPPEDLSSYMKIDQEILFKVDKVELENAFIQGSITDECIRLIKENIQVINDDVESTNGSFF